MEISRDHENGDLLIERDGIFITRIPAIVEAKWPGTATLLAAAPELLAALQEVVSVSDRATEIYDRARAAIAKATGQSE